MENELTLILDSDKKQIAYRLSDEDTWMYILDSVVRDLLITMGYDYDSINTAIDAAIASKED